MKLNQNEKGCLPPGRSYKTAKLLAVIVFLVAGMGNPYPMSAAGQGETSRIQEEIEIRGIVIDETGVPLPGANITEKGTLNGTITDLNGEYTISVPSSASILVFSFIGFQSQEIRIDDQRRINVGLEVEAIGLTEVVVVGYGTQKRVNLTGAVGTVQSEELVKIPVANTTNAIAGRLSGVIAKQTSGEPGKDGATLNIRGFGDPLVMVDGIERSFSDINPEEIESVSVLKDASAAIYGSRAGNGVILITTKRGKAQKTTLEYKNSFSWQSVANYPGFVNSGQYAELYRESEINDGVPESGLSYTEEDIANFYAGAPGYYNGDWWAATVRDWSPQHQHNLSLRGGTESVRFYGFVGYLRQEGIYKSGDNALDRFNLRSNIDVDISKNLSASLDISGKIQDLSSPVAGTQEVFTNIFNALPLYPVSLPDPDKVAYSGKGPQNPAAITTRNIAGYNDIGSNKYQTTIRLNYKVPFIKGLAARGRFDYLGTISLPKLWQKDYDLYTYDPSTDVYAKAATQDRISLREDIIRSRTLTGQISLNYERTFSTDHMVRGLFVYEIIDSKGNDFWAMRQEFLTSAIEQLFASGIENQDMSGKAWEDGRISYIGRANYAYQGKYLAEASFRYDGSNRFNPSHRWGFFPSFSAGWRISEESFLQKEWLNNLKLRASYSQSGRDNTGKFQFLTGYEYGADYIINDMLVKGIRSLGVPNPYITWENMTTYNAGFDMSVLKHKLSAEFDIFYRLRDGMLATRDKSLPNTIGAFLPAENLNSQSNRGFELTLGHRNRAGEFNYSIRGMISWARARWEYYDEPGYTDPDDIRINQRTGNWTNLSHGYSELGFFQTQEEIDAWPVDQDMNGNSTLVPGDMKYIDLNNDSILDWRDQDIIGKTGTPEWMLGLNFDFSYKGFDLSMLWQGAFGHYVEMDTRNIFSSSFPKPFEYMFTNRWTPGSEDALYPRASLATVDNNNRNSDFWLQPAAYIRLKAITFGYNFPDSWIQRAGISNLRIFVGGHNLLTFSGLNKYGFDPESPKDQSGKYYPQMKSVFFGLNLSL